MFWASVISVLFALSAFSIFEVVRVVWRREWGQLWLWGSMGIMGVALLAGVLLPPTPGHPKFLGIREDCFWVSVWGPGIISIAQRGQQRLAQRRRKGAV